MNNQEKLTEYLAVLLIECTGKDEKVRTVYHRFDENLMNKDDFINMLRDDDLLNKYIYDNKLYDSTSYEYFINKCIDILSKVDL